jgi:hypothetical protein
MTLTSPIRQIAAEVAAARVVLVPIAAIGLLLLLLLVRQSALLTHVHRVEAGYTGPPLADMAAIKVAAEGGHP